MKRLLLPLLLAVIVTTLFALSAVSDAAASRCRTKRCSGYKPTPIMTSPCRYWCEVTPRP